MIRTQSYVNNEHDYLIAPQMAFSLSCTVTTTADAKGNREIKAGTPLYIATGKNVYKDREEVLTTVSGSNTLVGIARHNIYNKDFNEDGKANDAVLLHGFVEFYCLDESVQTAVEAVESTLTDIHFVRGAK